MNLQEAKELKRGNILVPNLDQVEYFNKGGKNRDGSLMRFKVTSIKTWKRNPNRIQIGLSRGLYEHYKIDESEIMHFNKQS